MYAIGNYLGATQSELTGEQAAAEAYERFLHVQDMVKSMWSAAEGNISLRNEIWDFNERLEKWRKDQEVPFWEKLFKASASVGVGVLKILGLYKSDAEKYGSVLLQKVKAFEVDALTICSKVSKETGKTVTGCKALPEPQIVKQEEGLLGEAKSLAWIGVIGIGVYFGGKYLLSRKGR